MLTIQLRKSSSAAWQPEAVETQPLRRTDKQTCRKLLISLILEAWLLRLDSPPLAMSNANRGVTEDA